MRHKMEGKKGERDENFLIENQYEGFFLKAHKENGNIVASVKKV